MKATPDQLQDFNSLDPHQTALSLSGITQQTGVGFVDKRGVLIVDNFNESSNESSSVEIKRNFPNELIPQEHLSITLQLESQLESLTGLSDLIRILRRHILDLSQLDDKFLQSAIFFSLNQEQNRIFLEDKKSVIEKYIKSQVRIRLLLEAIKRLKDQDQRQYNLVTLQLENWQIILTQILPNLSKNNDLEGLIQNEVQKQGKNNQELLRLQNLLSGERAGSDQRAVEKLKIKVIAALLGQTANQQKTQVRADLVTELLVTANTLNDIRLVERFKEQGIDLLVLRDRIKEIKQLHKQNQKETKILNQEIIQIATLIANKIKELFPHKSNSSPTFIAAALYRGEAVCAGKTEILVSIFKLLGLEASSTYVYLTLDDSTDHAIVVLKLLDDLQLFIDANYSVCNEKKDDGKVIIGPPEAVVYSVQKISKEHFDAISDHKFVGLNPQGEKTYYWSSLRCPHKIIVWQPADEFSFSVHNNYAVSLQKLGRYEEAEKHYLEALKLNSNNFKAHYNYAVYLQKLGRYEEAEKHYLEALKLDQNCAWTITSYANFLQNRNRVSEAMEQYKQALRIMEENPNQPNWLTIKQINERYADLFVANFDW